MILFLGMFVEVGWYYRGWNNQFPWLAENRQHHLNQTDDGPVVLWSYGPVVLWSYGPMVLWSYGPMVLWAVMFKTHTSWVIVEGPSQHWQDHLNTNYNWPCKLPIFLFLYLPLYYLLISRYTCWIWWYIFSYFCPFIICLFPVIHVEFGDIYFLISAPVLFAYFPLYMLNLVIYIFLFLPLYYLLISRYTCWIWWYIFSYFCPCIICLYPVMHVEFGDIYFLISAPVLFAYLPLCM